MRPGVATASPAKLWLQNSISFFRLSNPCPPRWGEPRVVRKWLKTPLVAMFRWRYNQPSRMSATPPNPGRPDPKAGPTISSQTESNGPYALDGDEIPLEIDEKAQPEGEDGVMEDMATLAINPRLLANLEAAENHHAVGDFAQMDDATIMLELRTGNMAGFDYLIQKYRKPIIHFMYRMVHNQAVAEELAQEVFLR